MKYKDRYEDEDQHEQSVHSKTWQDMGKVTEFPEVDPAENDTIQK